MIPGWRCSPAVALCCAAFLLVAVSAPAAAQDLEAVGRRLIEGVKAGELSEAEAAEMLATVAKQRFLERLRRELGGATAPGATAPGEAATSEVTARLTALGLVQRDLFDIDRQLQVAGLTDGQRLPVLEALAACLAEVFEEEKDDPRTLMRPLEAAGLTEAQQVRIIYLVQDLVRRIEERRQASAAGPEATRRLKELGFTELEIGRLGQDLERYGVTRELLPRVFDGLAKALHALRDGSDDLSGFERELRGLGLSEDDTAGILSDAREIGLTFRESAKLERLWELARGYGLEEDLATNLRLGLGELGLEGDQRDEVAIMGLAGLATLKAGEPLNALPASLQAAGLTEAQTKAVIALVKRLHEGG